MAKSSGVQFKNKTFCKGFHSAFKNKKVWVLHFSTPKSSCICRNNLTAPRIDSELALLKMSIQSTYIFMSILYIRKEDRKVKPEIPGISLSQVKQRPSNKAINPVQSILAPVISLSRLKMDSSHVSAGVAHAISICSDRCFRGYGHRGDVLHIWWSFLKLNALWSRMFGHLQIWFQIVPNNARLGLPRHTFPGLFSYPKKWATSLFLAAKQSLEEVQSPFSRSQRPHKCDPG